VDNTKLPYWLIVVGVVALAWAVIDYLVEVWYWFLPLALGVSSMYAGLVEIFKTRRNRKGVRASPRKDHRGGKTDFREKP
jgi:hypothetical protein